MSIKNAGNLNSLEFLVGDWASEAPAGDSIIQRNISYRWVYDKHYLEAKSERISGDNVIQMTIIYLWDALAAEIRSWVRASDGEWSQASVIIIEEGIIQLDSKGANAKGDPSSLISTLEQLDSDTRTETWTDINMNGISMPSPPSIVWNRR